MQFFCFKEILMKTCRIGIISAMDVEIEELSSLLVDSKTFSVSGINFKYGKLFGRDVVLAVCGIGKVFAGICAQTMILNFHVSEIINVGIAGGLSETLSICDAAIADKAVQYDMDTTAIGDPLGLISGINIVYLPTDPAITKLLSECTGEIGVNYEVGTIGSGDTFVHSTDMKKNIIENFGAIACEMEGAAIAQACYINSVPCGIFRSISDGGNEASAIDYPTFRNIAVKDILRVMKLYIGKR